MASIQNQDGTDATQITRVVGGVLTNASAAYRVVNGVVTQIFALTTNANGVSGYEVTSGPTTSGGGVTTADVHVSYLVNPSSVASGTIYQTTETYFVRTTTAPTIVTTGYTCEITTQATGTGTNPTTCTPTSTVPVTRSIGGTYTGQVETDAGGTSDGPNLTRTVTLTGTMAAPTYAGVATVNDGVVGDRVTATVTNGTDTATVASITPEFYVLGSATYTVSYTIPTGYDGANTLGSDTDVASATRGAFRFNDLITGLNNRISINDSGTVLGVTSSWNTGFSSFEGDPIIGVITLQAGQTNPFPTLTAGGSSMNRTIAISVTMEIPEDYINEGDTDTFSGTITESQPAPPAVVDATGATASNLNPEFVFDDGVGTIRVSITPTPAGSRWNARSLGAGGVTVEGNGNARIGVQSITIRWDGSSSINLGTASVMIHSGTGSGTPLLTIPVSSDA